MNQLLAAFIVDVVGYRPEAHLPQKNFTQSISPIDFTRLLCPINSIAPAKTGSPKFISSLIKIIEMLKGAVGEAEPITNGAKREDNPTPFNKAKRSSSPIS